MALCFVMVSMAACASATRMAETILMRQCKQLRPPAHPEPMPPGISGVPLRASDPEGDAGVRAGTAVKARVETS
eukprot:8089199-Pyramimonas_sp.AAC.1